MAELGADGQGTFASKRPHVLSQLMEQEEWAAFGAHGFAEALAEVMHDALAGAHPDYQREVHKHLIRLILHKL